MRFALEWHVWYVLILKFHEKNLPPYWLLIRTCFNLATCWWKTCREFHEKFLYRGPKALTFTIQLKIARLRRIEIFFRDVTSESSDAAVVNCSEGSYKRLTPVPLSKYTHTAYVYLTLPPSAFPISKTKKGRFCSWNKQKNVS